MTYRAIDEPYDVPSARNGENPNPFGFGFSLVSHDTTPAEGEGFRCANLYMSPDQVISEPAATKREQPRE